MRKAHDLNPRKLPIQARSKVTYAAILQAAARILETDGYETLTTNRVADTAGIGIASLYEYFPNKQSVVAAVVTATVEDVLNEIERALDAALEQTPDAGIATWVTAMFNAVDKRRVLTAALIREVPFLHEVPAMRALRKRLLVLAARGQGMGAKPALFAHRNAMLYLLPMMVSSVIVEATTRPPRGVTRAELQAALIGLLRQVLFDA